MVAPKNNVIDIFLSYAQADFAKAQLLAQILELEGWSVSLGQPSAAVRQDDLSQVIKMAIKANCVIMVWSKDAIKSRWVFKEAEIAYRHKKLIILRIDASKLPPEFKALNTLDFAGWDGEPSSPPFIRVKDAVARLIGLPKNNSVKASKYARPKKTDAPAKPPLVQKKSLLLPDIDWVEIPTGPFFHGDETGAGYGSSGYGSGSFGGGYDYASQPDVERFFISRYTITHCQYQTFIDADGYREERWWQDLSKPLPVEANWKQPNRPRDSVNWYEAIAFCRWLSAQLGFVITLPTEQQWEKAARGTDGGREYPWGTNFQTGDANVFLENNPENLNQTAAVGLFPHRGSPYEVMDMAGNVWEWCLNQFDQPGQIVPNTSNAPRALRGGCWDLSPLNARTFIRRSRHPDLRDYDVGFRLVCQSPK